MRHLLQRTTAHNRRQKTTFVSQFITHVLTKSSVNFNQGLRAMTWRFCAHWVKSYSAVLQASTTSKLYQISMAWIVKCYQVRSQSLKTTTAFTKTTTAFTLREESLTKQSIFVEYSLFWKKHLSFAGTRRQMNITLYQNRPEDM